MYIALSDLYIYNALENIKKPITINLKCTALTWNDEF